MKEGLSLYFIALVPTEPFYKKAQGLKEYVSENFGAKASLKSPPHITLQMPFRIKDNKAKFLREKLKIFASSKTPFEVKHNGFGCFEPKVIYINVENSNSLISLQKALLIHLRRELKLEVSDYKNRGFTPHLTIAFRDLKKSIFEEAWSYFRNLSLNQSWMAKELCLLKHNGSSWDIDERYSFFSSSDKNKTN